DDHVTALWIAQPRQPAMRERHLGTVDQLVHEQEVAHLERVLHASARNLERFDEEGANDGEEHDGYGEDLRPLPDEIEGGTTLVELAQRFDPLFGRNRALLLLAGEIRLLFAHRCS